MALRESLVGMYFVTISQDGYNWQYQGQIHSEVAPGVYLVQYFDCIMGDPNDFAIYRLSDMHSWRLFETDEQMRDWQDRHKWREIKSQFETNLMQAPEDVRAAAIRVCDTMYLAQLWLREHDVSITHDALVSIASAIIAAEDTSRDD